MSTAQKILKDLRQFFKAASHDPSPYRVSEEDFTRKGKLHFGKLSLLMCSLLKSRCRASSTWPLAMA